MKHEENSIYIAEENLETYAESAAKDLKVDGSISARAAAALVRRALREISRCHDAASLKWQGLPSVPGAVRWLLDNHYLARREGLMAASAFAGGGSMRLTGEGPLLFCMCRALTRSGRFALSPERIERFLRGFQKERILTRTELAALEWGLRAALVSQLAELCARLEDEGALPALEGDASRIFGSLRWLSQCDLTEVVERADFIEQALRRDPAGIYPLMDEDSRMTYRAEISHLARKSGSTEYKTAQFVLSLAEKAEGEGRHVGWWLFRRPLGQPAPRRHGGWYIAINVLATLVLSLLPAFLAKSPAAFFLLLLPLSELIKSLLDFILLRVVKPCRLPRLELKDGVPEEGRTLCAVSCLLTGETDGPALARRLEEYRLCSRDPGENLLFALLADLPDTKSEELPGAENWVSAAGEAVETLNARYGGGFFLLTRPRVKSRDARFMGWERKRGALLETMRYLRGGESSVVCAAGDTAALKNVKYLLALDTDTRLTPDAARELIGAMLHPLNRPVWDENAGLVKSGYGILSPRVSPSLDSAGGSDFALVFAGQGGADPYSGVSGEVYMDCFRSGGFAGKGVIDIDAYLACDPGKIPENRVLSHDAIEGAFLRGGYLSTVELIDSFPRKPLSYYKRLHRWVRGDWQNLPWLFRRGRALPDIERWRLFDSLRRSLVPVMTLLAICAGFFSLREGTFIAALAALLSCLCQLIITAAETLLRSEQERGLRFHSRVFYGVGGGLVRTVLRLVLLPVEAWFCFNAVCRALWRMGVSKKGLLQWQTAGQSEKGGASLWRYYAAMWPSAALGMALVLLSPAILGKAAGIIWLLSPLCACLLGLPRKGQKPLTPRDKAYLMSCAKEIWGWFDAFLTPEDHFLPPDKYQALPPVGTAHRTSPTNIGLAMLSTLEALDLELTGPERCFYLLEKTLSTVERLEKWHGHLYNWYDTQTLEPLRPRYVSSVDSGNLYACLAAVRRGMEAYGKADLANRVSEIMCAMDFTPLYDKRRRLFAIGVDTETMQTPDSWYDLLSSEARLTGYVAIAKGDVPRRHWRKLSRALLAKNGYRGMASWTGTMFEYLMPELLLPMTRDSLLYESARFCLYAQKARTAGSGKPWGISESAFYSLDPSMSYRYKAHGCAALALKPGMDAELVVAPYASFLALAVEPRRAVENLRKLESFGARGEYGFWEAVDFTPTRCRSGKGSVVRCVMSHHLGMSMTALTNCLTDGLTVRRFLENPEMRAYEVLLQEKVPLGGVVLRRRENPRRERPARVFDEDWRLGGTVSDASGSAMCLLSGQVYSLRLGAGGAARALWGAVSPYLPASDDTGGLSLSLCAGGEEYPLSGADGSRWEFTPECARFFRETEHFSAAVTALLQQDDAGEIRRVEIKTGGIENARLSLSLSPLLAKYRDYIGHPAFWRLGLSMKIRDGCLLVRRLARNGLPESWLCLACDAPCVFESVPGLDGGRFAAPVPIGEDWLWPEDPLLRCSADMPSEEGSFTFTFSLAAAHSESAALAAAVRGLSLTLEDAGDLPRRAASVMGMGLSEFQNAWALLPWLALPTAPGEENCRVDGLWKLGISGDIPIVCAACTDTRQLDAARRLLDAHLLLTGCGQDFDLVFITSDGGSYLKPVTTALNELLWRNGGDALSGARGGVHIVDESRGTGTLRACAVLTLDLDAPETLPPLPPPSRAVKQTPSPVAVPACDWDERGGFVFDCAGALPPRMWSNLLTNGRFGFLAADCGGGNMWYLNARENALSPWQCRPLSAGGPEELYLRSGEQRTSLFAGDALRCRVRFGFGTARWEKRIGNASIEITAFVPPDADVRVLVIRCKGLGEDAALHWLLPLGLAPNEKDGRFVSTAGHDGQLWARNDRAMTDARPFGVSVNPPYAAFTCDGGKARGENYDGALGRAARPAFALTLPAGEETILVCGCDSPETLKALSAPEAAKAALEQTETFWRGKTETLCLRSPSPALDKLVNGWLLYQTLACRILGRCSIYQSGGAYGFRDQLQDTVNLIAFEPSLAREQILRSCRHQYTEGDVQHWWHEGDGTPRGVRTRCSDDLVWLPWAVCEYVEKTGDEALLTEFTPYLSSPVLEEGDRDRYEAAETSEVLESVLRHAMRAIDMVLRRGVGEHGLLRMGAGDWNDGFDAVGGESQWLTWFFCHTAGRFAALVEPDEPHCAARLRDAVKHLTDSANAAWDGKWFLRGWYADGTPLGSRENRCGQIDSIAQSFAALCPGADPEKLRTALASAYEILFDREHSLVKLFAPPFDGQGEYPGYLVSYGPGFRENGGQYTHGAVWLVLALFRTGQTDRAWELLRAMLPAEKNIAVYKGEPFVLAADVYTAPGREGEAGWTWYTGSSGWLLRVVTEELLGLKLRGGLLFIEPNLPPDWPGCTLRFHGHEISLSPGGVTVDGTAYHGGGLRLWEE